MGWASDVDLLRFWFCLVFTRADLLVEAWATKQRERHPAPRAPLKYVSHDVRRQDETGCVKVWMNINEKKRVFMRF